MFFLKKQRIFAKKIMTREEIIKTFTYNELEKIVLETPNDTELGEKVRRFYQELKEKLEKLKIN